MSRENEENNRKKVMMAISSCYRLNDYLDQIVPILNAKDAIIAEKEKEAEKWRLEYEEAREKAAEFEMDWFVLKQRIGEPLEGSNYDERLPRAKTWHEERLNWSAEVEKMRNSIAEKDAKIAGLEGRCNGYLDRIKELDGYKFK